MGNLMLSCIAILEGECSSPSGVSSASGTPVTRVTEQWHSRSQMVSTRTQTQRTKEEKQAEVAAVRMVPQEPSRDGGTAMAVLEEPASTSALTVVPGVISSAGGTVTPGTTQSVSVWPWVNRVVLVPPVLLPQTVGCGHCTHMGSNLRVVPS